MLVSSRQALYYLGGASLSECYLYWDRERAKLVISSFVPITSFQPPGLT
jgi:hypothetical protein